MMKKRATYVLFPLLVGFFATLLTAEPDFLQFPEVKEEQKEVILGLEKDISDVRREISAYGKLLRQYGFVNKKNQTRLGLTATLRTEYGLRHREVQNEWADITWNGDRVSDVFFEQRESYNDRSRMTRKRWYVNIHSEQSGTDKDGNPTYKLNGIEINLVIAELVPPERWSYRNFQVHTGADLRDKKREFNIPPEVKELGMQSIVVRDVSRRIGMLREYLRLLRLLERRVDWIFRRKGVGAEEDLDFLRR